MVHNGWVRHVISCVVVLFVSISPPQLAAQRGLHSTVGRDDSLLGFLVAPFAGLPITAGNPDQALGAHLLWPIESPVSLAARYEMRWTRDDLFYDAGSLDVQARMAGDQRGGFFATGGWATWDRRNYGTLGVRAVWPLIASAEGASSAVQGWFDLRYASLSAGEALRADGRIWAELMLVFVIWVGIGR